MNILLVGWKRVSISSNSYLSEIKHRFNIKKMGYSGTLDPFASGTLVIASGKYTKLLSHLNLTPKEYIATLHLGAFSKTLDISGLESITEIKSFSSSEVYDALLSLKGEVDFTPPSFSAKKINGIRAYKLARENKDFQLAKSKMHIFDISLISYIHPFITFKVKVSKGGYVRSIGELIARNLNTFGALSKLERVKEGSFAFESYKLLNPLDYIPYPCIDFSRNTSLDSNLYEDFYFGRKVVLKNEFLKNLPRQNRSRYIIFLKHFFSIIDLDAFGNVDYVLNRIPYVSSI